MLIYLTKPHQQFLKNVEIYAGHLGLSLAGLEVTSVDDHVVLFAGGTEPLLESIIESEKFRSVPLPHAGFQLNYRQNVMKWSMQVNLTENKAGFDIDRWNPDYGVAPAFMHWLDVVKHGVTNTDTDPYKVQKALTKMGLVVPLVK